MNAAFTVPAERYYYRFEEIEGDERSEAIGADAPASLDNYPDLPGDGGFWRRQFGNEVTPKQRHFDWCMGVVFPMLCFYFDPIVFRSDDFHGGILSDYQYPAYMLAFLAIMANAAWLLWGRQLGQLGAVAAFILGPASLVALAIGIILFPFSLMGLIFLIGFMGFTPLLSSFVYWRNSVRAMRSASEV